MARKATKLSDIALVKTTAEAPAPTAGPRGEDRAGTTKGQTRGQTIRLNTEAWKQLKMLAIDQERPAHALLVEAVNDLFEKHGKKRIA